MNLLVKLGELPPEGGGRSRLRVLDAIPAEEADEFFERLRLWLTDSSLYPTTHYIRRVPIWTIHRFTLLQLICLLALGIIEITPLGILFPLYIVLLVPIRFFAARFFTPDELAALDSEEEPEEEETDRIR